MQKILKKGMRIVLLIVMLVAVVGVIGVRVEKEEPFVCGTCLAWANGEFDFTNKTITVRTYGVGTTNYRQKIYIGSVVGTEKIRLIPEEGYVVGDVYLDGCTQEVEEDGSVYVTYGVTDRNLEVYFVPEQTEKQLVSVKR